MSSIRVAQASARGTLILFAGNLVSTSVATATIIIFARLLGPGGYGAYTLTFVLPSILQLFVGIGVSSAVTRYVAFSLSTGDTAKAASMTRSAMIFIIVFGLAISVLDSVLAPYFVVAFLHRPELLQYSQVAALSILAVALLQCGVSALIGWGSLLQVSGFTVLQAVVKLVVGAGLILAGVGVFGAVEGYVASYLVGGLSAALAIYLLRTRPSPGHVNHFFEDIRAMVGYGAPLFTGNIVSGLSLQYATVILASVAADTVVGYYQAAVNVTVLITVISGALAHVLFRSFAELHGLNEDIALAFKYAVRYVSLLLTPMVFFILAAAGPIFDVFYGPAYSQGIVLLKLVALSYLPVSVGLTVLPSFLNGVGRSRLTMLISITGATGLVLASSILVLGLGLGAEGIVLALLASNLGTIVPGLLLSQRLLGVRVAPGSLAGIFSAGFVAWLLAVLLPIGGLAGLSGWLVALLAEAVVYTAAYVALLPIFFGVDEDDLIRLSIAVDTMGPLKTLFGFFLAIERWILRLRGRVLRSSRATSGESAAGTARP